MGKEARSSFIFRLKANDRKQTLWSAKGRRNSVADETEGSSILVVDDSLEHLRLLGTILKRGGFVPRPVVSSKLAMEAAKVDPPDLVLLDIRMPEVSGLDVCRQLKQDSRLRDIPVIFISALQGEDDKVAAFRAGGVDYVCKPFQEQDVLERVKTHLRLSRLHLDLISCAPSAVHHSRHTILVVDDDVQLRRILDETLSRNDFDVLTAGDAGHALALLEKSLPCMILLDVELPDMNGLALCRRIRQDPRTAHIPVALVSSRVDEVDVNAGIAAGAVDYIKKPFDMDEVRMRVRMQIRMREVLGEQQRLHEHLSENERRLKAMFEQAAVGMAMVSAEGRMLRVNRRLCEIVGYPAEELLMLRFADLTHPEDLAADLEASRALRSGTKDSYAREKRYLRKDGRIVWIKLAVAAVRHGDGRFDYFVSVFEDITEHKQAEVALLESEAKYRGIFESSHDAILTLEPPTWRFIDANPSTLAMFRVKTVADLTSLSPADLSPERQHDGRLSEDAALEKIQTAMREGSTNFEWTHKRLSGQEFPAAVLLTRMDRGGRQFLQGAVRDLSEQKGLEIELGHARKLEAVGQLASGIAHEINTPAQYVGDGLHFLKEAFEGYRQLVRQYQRAVQALEMAGGQESLVGEIRGTEESIDLPYLDANAPGSFDSCQDGISRISTIVRAMKEFAHPDQKHKVPANLNQALQTTLAIAKNEYKYVAEVTTEFGDLPPVLCHVGDLNQVFLNLIVNAAHAIGDVVGQSGGKGTIRIRTSQEGTLARIDIADSGSGIPETIRQRVFEPFFTTKEVGKGTGQGLAIARSIVVTKHGGTIGFESAVGEGTTFTIRLPIGELPT
jgi:PAS domain S-box-containing protein